MGIQRSFPFSPGAVPAWPVIAKKLQHVGESHVIRMIDGLPAFPDEVPTDDWQELRISLNGGMVTLKRTSSGELQCVTWGTDDPALLASWEKLCACLAEC